MPMELSLSRVRPRAHGADPADPEPESQSQKRLCFVLGLAHSFYMTEAIMEKSSYLWDFATI